MLGVLQHADTILRGEENLRRDLRRPIRLILLFGGFYGCVMGTFSASSPDRFAQILYSAMKVPMLLLVTFLLAVPSFFVLNTLSGLRKDFSQAIAALITTQAALTIVLASLAPFTALWYLSFADYNAAVLFNGGMFAVASLCGQMILRRLYRPLIQRNARHRLLLRIWLILYIFVGIQMGWVLRPFIGAPGEPPRFFRQGAFSNAYIVVWQLILHAMRR